MSTVSIILPTYNGSAWIRRAVDSVVAQSFIDWELIIIDDGSSEDIQGKLPSDPRIRYLKNASNLGIQKTLNRGLAEANGQYIARIDDDDMWSDTTKLEQQVAFLAANPDHVLIGTGVVLVDEKGNELSRYTLPTTDRAIRAKILRKNCFIHSSVVFRNNGVRYSEEKTVFHAEDYELWLRLGMQGKVANLPLYGVTFMVRSNSLTGRNRCIQAWRILKLAWKYKTMYPCVLIGIITASVRYLGFIGLAIVPVPRRLFHWVQKIQKSM
jgi:glycosyltransferase involved in cell wall biosynthesis